jgi:hypothetical protein
MRASSVQANGAIGVRHGLTIVSQLGAADEQAARQRRTTSVLDPVLYHTVRAWLERDWPFHSIECAPRV